METGLPVTGRLRFESLSCVLRHKIRHHHRRHKRQHEHNGTHYGGGRPSYLPGSFVVEGGGDGDTGNWGPWSEPSDCSRSCGGGVAFQTRQCSDISVDGDEVCKGGFKRYFSCNIQVGDGFQARRSGGQGIYEVRLASHLLTVDGQAVA
uniref:Uncharacterized protein n=1 Tax=Timema monikensis TaxID=170555 RepID=A0A7R9HLB0_9NEOP|nr:unnamed protein product [Timema monikensis]